MKKLKYLRNTEVGNSLLIVAVLIGVAAILAVAGFFIWTRIQQSQNSAQQTSYVQPNVPALNPNTTTPPPAPNSTGGLDTSVKVAATTSDLDGYMSQLDKSNVNSLDNPQ